MGHDEVVLLSISLTSLNYNISEYMPRGGLLFKILKQ